MAFIVATKRRNFEVRESHSTLKGPRSRTLAVFDALTDEVIEKARARARSVNGLDPEELRRAARRAGAPVAREPADQAARELIAELGKGRQPEPRLRRLLIDKLGDGPAEVVTPSDASRAVAEWVAATPKERGKALTDLLLLADALPSGGRRGKPLKFPRFESQPT